MSIRRSASLLLVLLSVASPASADRLPTTVLPRHYGLTFTVDLPQARFEGAETIRVDVAEPAPRVVLHAVDLEFHEVTIAAGGTIQKATVSLNAADQTATLTVPTPLPKGAAEIRIRYRGLLTDDLRGFYLSRTPERSYAVTQFEATDARRAFPSFDEPAFKATFDVTLVIDRGDTAISNGAMISDTPGPLPTQHTMKFATTAKMSPYLVAMAVGDFQCLSGAADGTPIRICATPAKKDLGHVALEYTQQLLEFFNDYYAVAYPFGKLDVVAVPDFAAGAMENTGAIFYRETSLLADSRTAAVGTRKNIASILAHEIAHQWFGNLVTMAWWDDLWLNEGFATWMANKPLAALRPDWNIPVDEARETQEALNLDSLASTRSIHWPVSTPAEIDEVFDAIAYEKGAAVLRMIENYVGVETFRQGVNAYLQAHAYGNATSADFWTAIAAASRKPVDRIMPTFVNQPGAPLLELSLRCGDSGEMTRGTVTQQRFLLAAPAGAAPGGSWQVPVCTKTADSPAAGHCLVIDRTPQVIEQLAPGCPPWVFVNAGARGYYRTAYPPEMLRALAPRIATDLTPPERLSLVADEWALVRTGRHGVGDYLTLVSGFSAETSGGVLGDVTDRLAFIYAYLATDETRDRFEAFVRSVVRPILDRVGFAPAASDTDARRELRAVATAALGGIGRDPEVIARSRAALDRALAGGPPLDPTSADAVVSIASSHGDAALFDALIAEADSALAPQEHDRYMNALANFTDPALVDRALGLALSPKMRSQDTAGYLARFLGNPAINRRAWEWMKARWPDLAPKVMIFGGDARLIRSLGAFCDAASRDDVAAFVAAHPMPAAARTLTQTLERIDNCVALREQQTPLLIEWQKGDGSQFGGR